ncbi:MAG: hypothetical protein ABF289_19410, partial [Clostridiales bacterium]
VILEFIDITLKKHKNVLSKKDEKISTEEINENSIKNDRAKKIIKSNPKSNEIMSVDEALLMNSDNIKRKLIVETIKDDAFKYLRLLKKALNDSDTETSHYAAVAVSEMKRKMTISIQELSIKYNENSDDILVISSYTNTLKQYVESGLLDKNSKNKYNKEISSLLKKLIDLNPSKEHFMEKIHVDIELKNYKKAKFYCDSFIEQYKNSEEAYLMMMKYYYVQNDFMGFNNIIEKLKHSSAIFSEKSLNVVRFWDNKIYSNDIMEGK